MAISVSDTASEAEPEIYRVPISVRLVTVSWTLGSIIAGVILFQGWVHTEGIWYFVAPIVVLASFLAGLYGIHVQRSYYELYPDRFVVVLKNSRLSFYFAHSVLSVDSDGDILIGDIDKIYEFGIAIDRKHELIASLTKLMGKTDEYYFHSWRYASMLDRDGSAHFDNRSSIGDVILSICFLLASMLIAVASLMHDGKITSADGAQLTGALIGLIILNVGLFLLARLYKKTCIEISNDGIGTKRAFKRHTMTYGPNTTIEWGFRFFHRVVKVSNGIERVYIPSSIGHFEHALDLIEQRAVYADKEQLIGKPYSVRLLSVYRGITVFFTVIFAVFGLLFLWVSPTQIGWLFWVGLVAVGVFSAFALRPRRVDLFHDRVEYGSRRKRIVLYKKDLLRIEASREIAPNDIVLVFKENRCVRFRIHSLVNRHYHELYRALLRLYPDTPIRSS